MGGHYRTSKKRTTERHSRQTACRTGEPVPSFYGDLELPANDPDVVPIDFATIWKQVSSDASAAVAEVRERQRRLELRALSLDSAKSTDEEAAITSEWSVGRHLAVVADQDNLPPGPGELQGARPTRVTTKVESVIRTLRSWFVVAPQTTLLLCPAWVVLAVGITVVASAQLLAGSMGWALFLLSFRVAVSLLLPPPYSIGTSHSDRARPSFKAAVAGHVTDLLPLLCAALYLSARGHSTAAAFVALSCAVMVGGTEYRLAALQNAAYVRRLVAERAARNGSLLIGLVVAATWGSGLLWTIAVGHVLFGLAELHRVQRRDRRNTRRRRHLPDAKYKADCIHEFLTGTADEQCYPGEKHRTSG